MTRLAILALAPILVGCTLTQPFPLTRWPGVSDRDWAECRAEAQAAIDDPNWPGEPNATITAGILGAALAGGGDVALAGAAVAAVDVAAAIGYARPMSPDVAASLRGRNALTLCLQHRGYRE